jgi:hypothetical protein
MAAGAEDDEWVGSPFVIGAIEGRRIDEKFSWGRVAGEGVHEPRCGVVENVKR